MKAVQLVAHGAPGKLELRNVPDPKPAPGEVTVQVQACGLNHLDLWVEEAGLPIPIPLPRTPGGEVAGTIFESGGQVSEWRVGDRVAIQSNLYCGQCEYCEQGEEAICIRGRSLGVHVDGGLAERVVVPERSLVRLPDRVDFDTSAALTLAGSTAMHMLTRRATVRHGDRVLIIGASSGVGSVAIQIARELGAIIITTGSTEAKRSLAHHLGAHHVVDSTRSDWPEEVRRITGRRGVDVAIEHVGGAVLNQVFECLARNGTVVTCGATAGREVTVNIWSLFVKQHRLVGSYGRNRADVESVLNWATAGRLRPVIDSIYPLDRTAEAFAHLRSRMALGKVLVAPFEPVSESD